MLSGESSGTSGYSGWGCYKDHFIPGSEEKLSKYGLYCQGGGYKDPQDINSKTWWIQNKKTKETIFVLDEHQYDNFDSFYIKYHRKEKLDIIEKKVKNERS